MTTVAVTFTINLDTDAVHRAGNLDWWINYFNREHDAFTDREDVTWDDVYAAIATDYHTGGEWSEYVASTGVHVAHPDTDSPDVGTDVRSDEAGAGPNDDITPYGRPATYNGLPSGG